MNTKASPDLALAATIRLWHDRVVALEEQLDALRDLLQMAPEAPLNEAAWGLVGGYIAALDARWNIGGWLEWWWNECRLGESPSQAGINGEPMRDIKTIDDLIALVIDDLAQAETETETETEQT